MSQLECPHCFNQVPWGAKVCRGCQAEVEYGVPAAYGLLSIGLSVFGGYQVSFLAPESWPYPGWISGVSILVFMSIIGNKIFKNRSNFKRNYKTK
jgi:hypothetical protein